MILLVNLTLTNIVFCCVFVIRDLHGERIAERLQDFVGSRNVNENGADVFLLNPTWRSQLCRLANSLTTSAIDSNRSYCVMVNTIKVPVSVSG